MPNAPEGADVHILTGNCRANLEAQLEYLTTQEDILLQQIVILGAHTLPNTSIGDNPHVGRFSIVSTEEQLKKNEVQYFTFMKYKGCEAKVVILLDVTPADPRWNARGLYTAMSRAIHKLIILRS